MHEKRLRQDRISERARECHKQASSFTGMTGIFGERIHASSLRDTCECKNKGPEAEASWRAFIEAVYAKSGAARGMGQDMEAINAMLPDGHEPINDVPNDGDAVGALMKAWKERKASWLLTWCDGMVSILLKQLALHLWHSLVGTRSLSTSQKWAFSEAELWRPKHRPQPRTSPRVK